jgi:hypothetical protein
MHKYLALTLMLAFAVPAAADDSAKTIAPFLDEHTFAIVRLDVTKVNAEALFAVIGPFNDLDKAAIGSLQTRLDRWVTDLTKAGGRELYVVFSLADTLKFPFIVVPLSKGADAEVIAEALRPVNPYGGPGEKIGAAVVAGQKDVIGRVRALKPVARPELARTFAVAGESAVQVAFIPPPHLVRFFDENMPILPKEIGGGSSKNVSRGIKWAALGIDAPPKMALRLTVQSADAAAAKSLKNTLTRALTTLGEDKPLRKTLPDYDKMIALVTPKIEENRLVLRLDEKEMRSVFGPLLRQLMGAVWLNEASNNLKQLMLAIISDADSRMGVLPRNLTDKTGKKILLSWRVAILPYLGQEALYKEFHLDEPWDSDHNKKLIAKMPPVFAGRIATLNEHGKTVLLAPTGEMTAWPGKTIVYPAWFADGTANTILLVLADDAHAVEWTKPEDLPIDPKKPHTGLGQIGGRFVFGMAEASVRTAKSKLSKESLWAMFTANAGDVIGSDWDD